MRFPRALIMGASSFHFCFAASSSAAHIAASFFRMACAEIAMTYSRTTPSARSTCADPDATRDTHNSREPKAPSLGLFAGGLLASPRVRFFRPPKATELFAYCQTQTRAHWLGIHCATMPQCWIVLGVIYASVSLERDASPGCGKRSRQSNAIRTSAGESC